MTKRSDQPIRIALALAGVLLAVIAWLIFSDGKDPSGSGENQSPVRVVAGPANPPALAGRSPVVAPKRHFDPARPAVAPMAASQLVEDDPSPLADELHSKSRTGIEDLSVVMNLFTQYRTRFRTYPVGEDNASIVNALTGQNPGRLAFISRNHPAIDANGQLLDRWGSPFFFHLLGSEGLEVRSAGPDRKFYTPDDMCTASPKAREAAVAMKASD